MKLDVEELSATKRRLKVEIPGEEVDSALDKAYKDLNKSVKVDGFRPGKAPRPVLERLYHESVDADVVQKLVPQFYIKAVEEAKIHPVAEPSIEEKGLSAKKGKPLSFTAMVEVRPEFTLSEYKGIEVQDETVEVGDDEVALAIDEVRAMHSTLESIEEDRPAVKGDITIIDFEGFMDDKPFEGAKAENYTLELGSDSLIAGFEEQLVGSKPGDEKDVKVSFPADYRNKGLAGKEALFKVKVRELKKKVLPELDDSFVKSLGLDVGVDGLKDKVKADIHLQKIREVAARQKVRILDELAKRNTFEVPASMVEAEVKALMTRRYKEMTQSGQRPGNTGFDLRTWDAELRPVAEQRAKSALILSEVMEKEGIEATEEELMTAVRAMATETGRSPKEIMDIYEKKEGGLDALRSVIAEEKVLEFLLKEAKRS